MAKRGGSHCDKLLRKALSGTGVYGDGGRSIRIHGTKLYHWSPSTSGPHRSFAAALAVPAPMLSSGRRVESRSAPCGGPVAARTKPAVATSRTMLGGRLLIRFSIVSMLISLMGVAA
jgi:hypothetical protein